MLCQYKVRRSLCRGSRLESLWASTPVQPEQVGPSHRALLSSDDLLHQGIAPKV
jgi:hypothetical protein